jgi:hypothetical protein
MPAHQDGHISETHHSDTRLAALRVRLSLGLESRTGQAMTVHRHGGFSTGQSGGRPAIFSARATWPAPRAPLRCRRYCRTAAVRTPQPVRRRILLRTSTPLRHHRRRQRGSSHALAAVPNLCSCLRATGSNGSPVSADIAIPILLPIRSSDRTHASGHLRIAAAAHFPIAPRPS